MTPIYLDIHPQAIREARAARRRYARVTLGLSLRFVAEFDHAVFQVTTAPQSWPAYLHGTRVYRLRHFPFLVVYLDLGLLVRIIAVAHGSRRPGYWRRRVP